MSLRTSAAALLLAGLLSLGACASDDDYMHEESVWEIVEGSKDYPLDTCPISGRTLDDRRIAVDYQGEEVQVHCESDLHAFLANPEPVLARVRAAKQR